MIFLSTSGTPVSAFDFENSSIPVVVPSIAAVGLMSHALYQYSYTLWNNNNVLVMEKEYPHALAWYKDLIEKYPCAYFEKKQFLCGNKGSKEWQNCIHQIYCPRHFLRDIDILYAKKKKGIKLVDSDMNFLKHQEFNILGQAAAIENNHMTYRYLSIFGLVVGLESVRALYKNFTDSDTRAYFNSQSSLTCYGMKKHTAPFYFQSRKSWDELVNIKMSNRDFDMFSYEFAAFLFSYLIFTKYQDYQEDAFAYEHIDNDGIPFQYDDMINTQQRDEVENTEFVEMKIEEGDKPHELKAARQRILQENSLEESTYELVDDDTANILMNKKAILQSMHKNIVLKGATRGNVISLSGSIDVANITAFQEAVFANKGLVGKSLSEKLTFIHGDFIIIASIFYGKTHVRKDALMVSYHSCLLEELFVHTEGAIIELCDTIVTGDIVFDYPGVLVIDENTILVGTISNARVVRITNS